MSKVKLGLGVWSLALFLVVAFTPHTAQAAAAPVIGTFSGNVFYNPVTGQVITLASKATVTSTLPNFNNGVLTISITANGLAEDKLAIANVGTGAGQIGVSGANVTFGGTTIGTFTGGVFPAALVVTFNASATPAAVKALLDNVTYQDTATPATTSARTVQAQVDDGSGSGTSLSNAATLTLIVDTLIFGPLTPSSATLNTVYSGTIALTGGIQPYTTPGLSGLPAGLTVALSGGNTITVTGTPTQFGSFTGNITIIDNTGFTLTKPYTLNVSDTPKLFNTGNILVTRSVYSAPPATITMGQALPGGGVAVSDATYPFVFNNETPDAAFGITSPIFIDQLTPSGTVLNTLAVPTALVTTSFPSKSEVGLNISSNGNAITFMAYTAATNTLDVSNSNTPGHVDPTNPVTSSFQRAVVQLDLYGNFTVTPTNAYSGNNGRNAILYNGNYYMVGNAGNSGAGTTETTFDLLSDDTGVQMIAPGAGGDSTVVGVVKGTLGVKGYQHGFSVTDINPFTGLAYGPVDKTGKDDNFRALTIYKNTLYCTKGSGGNGVNTVYQVGTAGSIPTAANAATTPITVLPGLPSVLANKPTARFPFGIFFANDTTLYVCDEGDGTLANAATDTQSGLQKWILSNGVWSLAYTLQNGLNLGTPYAVPNGPNGEVYPTGINPATTKLWTPANDGLRNIAGVVNANGTVTIYAVTSTVSGATDQGADPNQVVTITDNLSFTTGSQAANEVFTVLKQATYGEVLRGVLAIPEPQSTPVTFNAVAAGDVTTNDVILWTRAQPAVATSLTAQVATDANFNNIVKKVSGTTDPAQDYTLKVNPTGLNAGTRYYYRFVGPVGELSTVGTFKTAYAAGTKAAVHFAFSGDCDGQWRPFPSVFEIGTQNLDFFEFCGDTMYENASSPSTGFAPISGKVTAPELNPGQTLIDLRRKYRENITAVTTNGNPSLQNLFAAQANYTLLDNHELCSNVGTGQYQCGGAPQFAPDNPAINYILATNPVSTDINLAGPFANKTLGFMACQQAFRNYEPIRERVVSAPADPRTDGTQQMYTSQQWGKNLMFIHTDDRSYADARLTVTTARADNPQRTRLGATQLAWLEATLLSAQTAGIPWKVVVVSDPIDQLGPVGGALTGTNANLTNTDGSKSWMGGYRVERNALMKYIADNKITNVVFLATDDHTNRVNELLYYPDPVNAPTVQAYVPTCFSIVAGPVGASGPENFTDHTFATLLGLANTYAGAQVSAGVNPIGLDPAFPGLHDVVRENDATSDTTRGPIDFFSPDTENYETLDISANGKTLTVTTWGINSYAPNIFLEPSATGSVRQILSFQVDANVNAITLAASAPSGLAGIAIPLTITPTLASTFPQTVTVKITGVPATTTLSAGTNAGGGVWNLTSAQLTGLKLTSTVAASIPLTVTATDLDGSNLAIGTATTPLTVTVTTNAAPVASNQSITVTGTAAFAGTLVATDAESEALTFAIVTNGTKGTAAITNTTTGAFTYTATVAVAASTTDTFTFKATDANGTSNTATVTVTILPTVTPPTGTGTVTTTGTITSGNSVSFDATGSSPNSVFYVWDFGDGTLGFGLKPTHVYTAAGNYTVTVTPYNAQGIAGTPATMTVTVVAAVPPSIPTSTFTGKFGKSGKVTLKLNVNLPTGTAAGTSVTVKIGSFTATFSPVTAGKVAHTKAGTLKVTGQSLAFVLKTDATSIFGSVPTSGSKTVNITVNSTNFVATPTFNTKGANTSF